MDWSSFVPLEYLENMEQKTGQTRVCARVVEVMHNKVLLQLPDDAIMNTLLSISRTLYEQYASEHIR